MIDEISVSILFQGETFSPKLAEEITGFDFEDKNEVGDIGTRGRYKGKAIPYGSAQITPPKHIEMHDRILWLAKALDGKVDQFQAMGSDEPYIYIGYFYKNQCNLSLSKEELAAIAKLNIEFCFSCYDVSDRGVEC